MEDGLFTNQGKKLMLIGIFLWGVAMLIGGEEDPGMIAQVSEGGAEEMTHHGPASGAPAYPPPPQATRVQPQTQQDPSLAAWYAEATPSEAVSPDPVDESHLIDDTVPAVSTDPIVQ
jgi:hypothetical protein